MPASELSHFELHRSKSTGSQSWHLLSQLQRYNNKTWLKKPSPQSYRVSDLKMFFFQVTNSAILPQSLAQFCFLICTEKARYLMYVSITFSRGRNTRGENWMLCKGQSKESTVFLIILRWFLVIFSTTTFIPFPKPFPKLNFRRSFWGAEQI